MVSRVIRASRWCWRIAAKAPNDSTMLPNAPSRRTRISRVIGWTKEGQGLCPGTPPRGSAPWIPAKGTALGTLHFGWMAGGACTVRLGCLRAGGRRLAGSRGARCRPPPPSNQNGWIAKAPPLLGGPGGKAPLVGLQGQSPWPSFAHPGHAALRHKNPISVSLGAGNRRRMGSSPVPRDIEPPRGPHASKPADIIQQAFQPSRPRGVANQPLVQADRQHARLRPPLAIQEVERVAAVVEEVVTSRKGATPKLGVVRRHV